MDKLDPKTDGASKDITAENIEALKRLFPECVTEGKVDFDVLRELLGGEIDDRPDRYSFTWNGKSLARRIAQTPSTGTLRPCPEESVNWDTTQNIFIEGDNLEVLKLLQKSYHKRVKMIYIDPPYNTGKEFIYPDRYKDNLDTYLRYTRQIDDDGFKVSENSETAGRYHTNWLNMMYPRLRLARNLISDDGFVFISIDDHEVGNLRSMCSEILGEENFRGMVSRVTGTPSGQGYDILVNEVDYVLVYSKSTLGTLGGLALGEDDEKIYDQEDEFGRYLTRPLRKTGGEDRREDRPTMYFEVNDPEGNPVFPIGPGGYESRWRCGPNKYRELVAQNRIEWKKVRDNGEEQWKPYQKFYLEGRTKQPSNLWTGIEGNKKASIDVRNLFGGKIFDFPKPIELIERCISISAGDTD